jgi:hypothetical protein
MRRSLIRSILAGASAVAPNNSLQDHDRAARLILIPLLILIFFRLRDPMIFNLDRQFFTILQASGIEITWEEFRAAYAVRKAQREKDPKWLESRKRYQQEQQAIVALFDQFLVDYKPHELQHKD